VSQPIEYQRFLQRPGLILLGLFHFFSVKTVKIGINFWLYIDQNRVSVRVTNEERSLIESGKR
jgi:hypothetical protein